MIISRFLSLALSLGLGLTLCASESQVPLKLELPKSKFTGTPKNITSPNLEPLRTGPRPDILVPAGCTNLAAKAPVTSSDKEPVIGELPMITDGDKDASSGSFVELGPETQWVQVDLGAPSAIWAVVLWHYHSEARIYRATVVQVADDAAFTQNVRTVFNNDADNVSGLGVGKDQEYIDNNEGKLIPANGVVARYVRCSSKGNTSNDLNHYVEVEVWGKKK